MRMHKRLSVHFIIQAQKSIGIKKEIDENKDKEVIVVDYQINEEEAKRKHLQEKKMLDCSSQYTTANFSGGCAICKVQLILRCCGCGVVGRGANGGAEQRSAWSGMPCVLEWYSVG